MRISLPLQCLSSRSSNISLPRWCMLVYIHLALFYNMRCFVQPDAYNNPRATAPDPSPQAPSVPSPRCLDLGLFQVMQRRVSRQILSWNPESASQKRRVPDKLQPLSNQEWKVIHKLGIKLMSMVEDNDVVVDYGHELRNFVAIDCIKPSNYCITFFFVFDLGGGNLPNPPVLQAPKGPNIVGLP